MERRVKENPPYAAEIEHSLRRERRQHLAAFFARIGAEVEEGSAGQTGLFVQPYALFSVYLAP